MVNMWLENMWVEEVFVEYHTHRFALVLYSVIDKRQYVRVTITDTATRELTR